MTQLTQGTILISLNGDWMSSVCIIATHKHSIEMKYFSMLKTHFAQQKVSNKKSMQKVKSSAETEVTGVENALSQVLWTNCFMKMQGWSHNATIQKR